MTNLTLEHIQRIRANLLSWYRQNKRELPWRGETNPYRIWISEVMLQQTQVVTVIPYYERFLERFPSVQALAAAPLDDVLKMWEGLGYYARARNLHKAAREVIRNWNGVLPDNFADLRRLPGLGDYTAGAVASIAFDEPVPAVDGNVRRVLARLFAIESDVRRGEGARQIKALSEALVPQDNPGDWTEAIMELGAIICTPTSPTCLLCPVRDQCAGLGRGIQEQLPKKSARKKLPHYDVTAAVIQDGDKFLIAQRPEDRMLGGLWEFPGGKCEENETLQECLKREIKEELDVTIEVGPMLTEVKHGYTHFRITLYAFHCRIISGRPQAIEVANWRWVVPEHFDYFAFPRTDQKIIAALQSHLVG